MRHNPFSHIHVNMASSHDVKISLTQYRIGITRVVTVFKSKQSVDALTSHYISRSLHQSFLQSIRKSYGNTSEICIPDDQGINSVSCGARNVTDDGPVSSQQSIEQTGLPHIRSTDKGDVSCVFFEHFSDLLHVRCGDLIYGVCKYSGERCSLGVESRKFLSSVS